MAILERLRYLIFWLIDFIKGSKVKKHLLDITLILNNFSSISAKNKRETHLNNILNHAVKTTNFYKKVSNFEKLEDFPIINKSLIKKNEKEFQSFTFSNKKTHKVSTSGSTGFPMSIYHDQNKKNRNTADTIYFSNLSGFKIGYKILYLRLWYKHLKKNKLTVFKQNITPISVLDLNDEYISKLLKQIQQDKSNKGWLGYASGFEFLCKFLDRTNAKPIHANVKSIISISEPLNLYTKSTMEKYFNAPVVSRYSNSENGIIAQQNSKENNHFKINWASYYIEILEFNTNKPSKEGDLGRIIVTDLFNYSMPFIRYDTGDLGAIDYTVTPPVLKKIEGRKSDVIYNTDGDIIPALIIGEIIKYNGIIQAQLIQETKTFYKLNLNVSPDFIQESEITSEFKNYLGDNAKIKIVYVNEIPLLASGKRKVTINNYLNQ